MNKEIERSVEEKLKALSAEGLVSEMMNLLVAMRALLSLGCYDDVEVFSQCLAACALAMPKALDREREKKQL